MKKIAFDAVIKVRFTSLDIKHSNVKISME